METCMEVYRWLIVERLARDMHANNVAEEKRKQEKSARIYILNDEMFLDKHRW